MTSVNYLKIPSDHSPEEIVEDDETSFHSHILAEI
jgi:hypothetical protein